MEAISKVFDHVSGFAKKLTELLLTVLSLGVVAQVLLGEAMFGMDVIGNIVAIIDALGNGGVVGIIAIVVLISLFNKK
tara:strand:- start:166 stop:399 length:234 start_codon:yes stop_codon:yes gene_type:complete